MSEPEKIIMIDAPGIVERVMVERWKASDGRTYPDERTARYASCTHEPCEVCGKPAEKSYTHCDGCRDARDLERYLALPLVEWDEETPLCLYGDDTYFFDPDEVYDYCESEEVAVEDLRLVVCVPAKPPQLGDDWFEEFCPIECDSLSDWSPKMAAALADFNARVAADLPAAWLPGKQRVALKSQPREEPANG